MSPRRLFLGLVFSLAFVSQVVLSAPPVKPPQPQPPKPPAAPAKMAVSEAQFNFGQIPTGKTETYPFSLSNTGEAPANGLALSGLSAPFGVANNTCGTSLAAGTKCTFVISFVAGNAPAKDQLAIGCQGGQPLKVNVQGVGVAPATPATLAVSETQFNFGPVNAGQTASHAFSLSNFGETPATGVTLSGLAAPFALVNSNCAVTLAPKATCSFAINFVAGTTPTKDQLLIGHQGGQPLKIKVQGVGVVPLSPALLAISENQFNFGSVNAGLTASHSFSQGNSGQLPANGLQLGGLNASFAVANSCCGASLAAGARCEKGSVG